MDVPCFTAHFITLYLLCHLSHLKKIYDFYFQVKFCLQKAAEIEYFGGLYL